MRVVTLAKSHTLPALASAMADWPASSELRIIDDQIYASDAAPDTAAAYAKQRAKVYQLLRGLLASRLAITAPLATAFLCRLLRKEATAAVTVADLQRINRAAQYAARLQQRAPWAVVETLVCDFDVLLGLGISEERVRAIQRSPLANKAVELLEAMRDGYLVKFTQVLASLGNSSTADRLLQAINDALIEKADLDPHCPAPYLNRDYLRLFKAKHSCTSIDLIESFFAGQSDTRLDPLRPKGGALSFCLMPDLQCERDMAGVNSGMPAAMYRVVRTLQDPLWLSADFLLGLARLVLLHACVPGDPQARISSADLINARLRQHPVQIGPYIRDCADASHDGDEELRRLMQSMSRDVQGGYFVEVALPSATPANLVWQAGCKDVHLEDDIKLLLDKTFDYYRIQQGRVAGRNAKLGLIVEVCRRVNLIRPLEHGNEAVLALLLNWLLMHAGCQPCILQSAEQWNWMSHRQLLAILQRSQQVDWS